MNIMIVDDERLARERLRALIEEIGFGEVIAEAANGREAVKTAQVCLPDVILLDIRMPGMDGISAATELNKLHPSPCLIFTTAYEEHALEAFANQAVSYLLKPIRKSELEKALLRAHKLGNGSESGSNIHPKVRSHISVTLRGETKMIQVNQIYYFLADQKYVQLRWREGTALLSETLKGLEQEFAGQFLRIHRSTLVSIVNIASLHKERNGHTYIKLRGLGEALEVSRRHLPGVRRVLKDMRIPMMED